MLRLASSMDSGAGTYAHLVESTWKRRSSPSTQGPLRGVVNLLAPGAPPSGVFADWAPEQRSLSVLTYESKDVPMYVELLGLSDEIGLVVNGLDVSKTKCIVFPTGSPAAMEALMEMHIGRNRFSFVSYDTHKGNFPKSEVVVTVRMIKKLQATPAVTHFRATIYKSIIGGNEKFSDLPKVRYAEMNRIEVAFATVKDSQVFWSAMMPGLIDEGYLFVDEVTNEFWRKAGSPSSNSSGSASVSAWVELSAMDQASTVVLVDVEENLFPPPIRSLIASALHAKGTRVTEDGISLRKLRWTLGNPRLPAWACSCEHLSGLNGATASYTGGKFVVRSADDWTSGYTAWRRSGPASRGPGPAPTTPSPSNPGVIPGPPAGPPPAPPSSYPVASPPHPVSYPVAPAPSLLATSPPPASNGPVSVAQPATPLPARGRGQQMPSAPQPDGFSTSAMARGFVAPTAETLKQHNWLQSLKAFGARFRLDV